MKDLLTSLTRSLVPFLVMLWGPWTAEWLGWTEGDLSTVLTLGLGAVWLLGARLLEQLHPAFGLLLAIPRQPTYPRDGRHELGRREDVGSSRPCVAVVVAVVAVLVAATTLLAGGADARPAPKPVTVVKVIPIPHIGITRVVDCAGALTVSYGLEDPATRDDGPTLSVTGDVASAWQGRGPLQRAWLFRQDNGTTRVDLHHIGAAAGPGGHWDPVPPELVRLSIEGTISVLIAGEPTWDSLRVVTLLPGIGWVASSPALPPAEGCEA